MEISRLDLERELRSRFALYSPYAKQMEFHNSLANCRLISGANQSGKTIAGTHETAFQATGIYPDCPYLLLSQPSFHVTKVFGLYAKLCHKRK